MQQRRIMYILRQNNKAFKYRKKKPILTKMYSHSVLSFYKNICGGVKEGSIKGLINKTISSFKNWSNNTD